MEDTNKRNLWKDLPAVVEGEGMPHTSLQTFAAEVVHTPKDRIEQHQDTYPAGAYTPDPEG